MKNNSYGKNIKTNCAVCKSEVYVDQFGNGTCKNCGWKQSIQCLDFPDKVFYPNMVAYNKAKKLYSEGSIFIPSIEDFLQGLEMYSEMQFYYQSTRYGVVFGKNRVINFYEWNTENGYQIYADKKEFIEKANINGKLLKDIWIDVENAEYMNCD